MPTRPRNDDGHYFTAVCVTLNVLLALPMGSAYSSLPLRVRRIGVGVWVSH